MLEAGAVFGGMLYHWPVKADSLQKCTLRHDGREERGVRGVGVGFVRGTVRALALLMDRAAGLSAKSVQHCL